MYQDGGRGKDDEHPVILNSLDFIRAIRQTLDTLINS